MESTSIVISQMYKPIRGPKGINKPIISYKPNLAAQKKNLISKGQPFFFMQPNSQTSCSDIPQRRSSSCSTIPDTVVISSSSSSMVNQNSRIRIFLARSRTYLAPLSCQVDKGSLPKSGHLCNMDHPIGYQSNRTTSKGTNI